MRWTKCWATTARRDSLRRARIVSPVLTALVLPPIILALLGGVALPQGTTQGTTQEPVLRSQSNVVLVPALVKDRQGGVVYGLQARNFIVEDDGVEQAARLDESPEGQPISMVVAIQRGRRAYAEFPRLQGLKSMLDPLFDLGTARVAIVEFDSQVELTRNFTKDGSLLSDDLSNLQPGNGGAAILDAVSYSINLLTQEPVERQRVLLLISETRDHGSRAKIADTVAGIGQSNTTMYALA